MREVKRAKTIERKETLTSVNRKERAKSPMKTRTVEPRRKDAFPEEKKGTGKLSDSVELEPPQTAFRSEGEGRPRTKDLVAKEESRLIDAAPATLPENQSVTALKRPGRRGGVQINEKSDKPDVPKKARQTITGNGSMKPPV